MKTYLVHHTPKSATQDTWAVSFSLPYIATSYARAGDGLWYVKTRLTAEQIKKRLAVLFDESDELHIQELGRDVVMLNSRMSWLDGRLEIEDPTLESLLDGPRAAWAAFQALVADIAQPLTANPAAATSRNLRAA